MTAIAEAPNDVEAAVEGLSLRLLGSMVGLMEIGTIRIGVETGLYAALAADGPATAPELAERAGTDERYTREWLEQQAVAGLLDVSGEADASPRRYAIPAAHAEVLLNRDSPAYLGALGLLTDMTRVLPEIVRAFRTGAGVGWAQYGDALRDGQAELNRPGYMTQLASTWLPAIPAVHARLQEGSARVADVCCGAGWSSIALALAYPLIEVDAFDGDDASIADARRNAAEAGVADRVRFEVRDAAEPQLDQGAYDLVIAFECIHDLARPVEALAAMRRLAKPAGYVLVADNAVDENFTAPGHEIERLLYASSVLVCLPTGRDHDHSEATGAVMRPSTFRRYATQAGFADAQTADVPHPFWRFWMLS
jgi:SAM-dependent methyltransferase